MKYKINEIFKSIQGEGANLGKEVIFIRMSGCNLNCKWCDTDHEKFKEMRTEEIMKEIKKLQISSVIITGGEPTEQNLLPLIQELSKKDYWVGIETNGTNGLNAAKKFINYVAFSPKKNTEIDSSFKELSDEIRVVNDNLTIEDILKYDSWNIKNRFIGVLEKNGKYNTKNTVLLLGKVNERSNFKWRINMQYHKALKIR